GADTYLLGAVSVEVVASTHGRPPATAGHGGVARRRPSRLHSAKHLPPGAPREHPFLWGRRWTAGPRGRQKARAGPAPSVRPRRGRRQCRERGGRPRLDRTPVWRI